MKRGFFFLHLCAGLGDALGEAIEEEARPHRMKVTVRSVDKELAGSDLLKEQPFGEIHEEEKGGKWACTSFSKLRWRKAYRYPGPCRSARCPYGIPTNNQRLQA